MDTRQLLPPLAAAVAALMSGAAVVATRYVIADTGPFSLGVWRYGIGLLILGILALLTKRQSFERQDIVPLVLLGVLFFSIFPALSNAALAHTSASRGALVMSLMPVTTLTLSVLLGEETLSRMKIAGVLSAIAGVAVALGDRASLPNEPGAWIGDLLMGAAILIGTIYSVFLRRYLGRYSALVLTAFGMMIGVITMTIMAGIFEDFFTQAPRFSPSGWLAILFMGVGAAAIGFFLWNWALKHTTATRVTVCLSLNPVAALALAVPLLNEPLTINLIAGMMLVVLGIVLTNWGGGSKARTASPVGGATGHD